MRWIYGFGTNLQKCAYISRNDISKTAFLVFFSWFWSLPLIGKTIFVHLCSSNSDLCSYHSTEQLLKTPFFYFLSQKFKLSEKYKKNFGCFGFCNKIIRMIVFDQPFGHFWFCYKLIRIIIFDQLFGRFWFCYKPIYIIMFDQHLWMFVFFVTKSYAKSFLTNLFGCFCNTILSIICDFLSKSLFFTKI